VLKTLGYSHVERLEHRVPFVVTEDNRMASANAGLEAGEHAEILSRQVANEAFGHILCSGLPSLYRGAYRLLGNAADAEDAVQDGLLAAYAHLDQFRGQSKMSTWLAAIVHNSARMQLRRRLRHIHVPLDEPIGKVEEHSALQRLADRRPTPEEEYGDAELDRRLSDFQTQLTPALRRTFQLRVIDGLSIRETARILGIPHGTVKAQSTRARKKLRNLMQRALRSRTRPLAHAPARHTLARI
jgi:RNA polymerase sigma-70 factor, ECF subfamily